MPGPFLVRKPKNLLDADGAVTGDGKGSENPVPVRGANQVVLLVDCNRSTSSKTLDIYMETSINGTDYYRETALSVSGGTATVTKKTYTYAGTTSTDDRIAIAMDVLSAFARFTFDLSTTGTVDWGNVACRAITGRV